MLFALATLSASSGVYASCGVPGTVSAFDALPGLAAAAVEEEDDDVSMPATLAASLSILLMWANVVACEHCGRAGVVAGCCCGCCTVGTPAVAVPAAAIAVGGVAVLVGPAAFVATAV